jgi:dTDP-4-dehydrorhamnose 3,5-epimerase
MNYKKLSLPEVVLFEPEIFNDKRGFNFEAFNLKKFKKITGKRVNFVQTNMSMSSKNVLRGIHYQMAPCAQGKLVQVIKGEVFDIAVDLRKSSKNFGKWAGTKLNDKNKKLLWIPEGFGHGFYTLSKKAIMIYHLTNFYNPKKEKSIIWDDPQINIRWSTKKNIKPLISSKDHNGSNLNNAKVFK